MTEKKTIARKMRAMGLMGLIGLVCLVGLPAHAQIKIGGNVYGGGNVGKVNGNTTVQVKAGDLNRVYGGARMADVGGSSYVNIDGENATDYMVINYVYGGNDIAGTIGTREAESAGEKTLPAEIASNKDGVDISWNSYVHLSAKTETVDGKVQAASDNKKVYIGQLFAGGNGEYFYKKIADDDYRIYYSEADYNKDANSHIASNATGFSVPEVGKAYLDIQGGSIVYAYGGGNNATVTDKTVIHVDNPSEVVNYVIVDKETRQENTSVTEAQFEASSYDTDKYENLLTAARFKDEMGINTAFSKPSSDAFQIGRLFGGNNQAVMRIQPQWNLQSGKVRNLYSGGNKGDMTYENGLLLEIKEGSTIKVDNVYGGCRMANVEPKKWNSDTGTYEDVVEVLGTIGIYKFPDNLAARVVVAGGDINNVYGGNDVTGRVRFGSAVGINYSIRGNVYGGGNGAYPYTNQDFFGKDLNYADFFYDSKSVENSQALNDYRPNAEQVSILLRGSEEKPTYIGGSVYLGGNCATLKANQDHSSLPNYPLVELKIGSHVYADQVFLGNNGEDMVNEDILKQYAFEEGGYKYNSLNLSTASYFAKYMDGVSMDIRPRLTFESTENGDRHDYDAYTSYIGSLYLGGNRGSMTYAGTNTMNFSTPLYIYDKVVGGCNNANVKAGTYNAAYEGGILGSVGEQTETSGKTAFEGQDRLVMNFDGLRIRPLRWKDIYEKVESGTTLKAGYEYYTEKNRSSRFTAIGTEMADDTNIYYELPVKSTELIWNTVKEGEDGSIEETDPVTEGTGTASSEDLARRFIGGNVYGGCYTSGHVNGNVVINLNSTIHERDVLFDEVVAEDDEGNATEKLYDIRDDYSITERRSGVALHKQGMDALGQSLNIFGGGYGKDTEIWGSTTVNLNRGFTFQIFGGSENGVIGKSKSGGGDYTFNDKSYDYGQAYSTTVNLNDSKNEIGKATPGTDQAQTLFIYGGGFEGPIAGDTHVNLDNGWLFNSFAGSCNADILGHTETYIGLKGFPYTPDHIYGGNDLSGEVKGTADFSSHVSSEGVLAMVHEKDADKDGKKDVLQASAYVEYQKGHVDYIFGGCYGDYEYGEGGDYASYVHPRMDNAFVNFRPAAGSNNSVSKVFGAGQGSSGYRGGDQSQDRSYVLIDIPDDMENFQTMEVFGAGSNSGLGMNSTYAETTASGYDLDQVSAIVDLVRGKAGAAYGGSFNEGVTRRTMVNVPAGSTIQIGSIFGGAYGDDLLAPCDVYEAHVNYSSPDALMIYNPDNELMKGAIYGGNNTCRRTLYGFVDINAPVWQQHPKWGKTRANVYGAGCGPMTWSEYTEVNLNENAEVYDVYGGAQNGEVLNAESAKAFMNKYMNGENLPEFLQTIFTTRGYNTEDWNTKIWPYCWTLGEGYYYPWKDGIFDVDNKFDGYPDNEATNLTNSLTRTAEMDDRDYSDARNKASDRNKYNTNVLIHEGAYVAGYAYGGGLGDGTPGTGDVYGTTYIALLGGTVNKDLYAAGTSGVVYDNYESGEFIASSNAYIKGGTCRNVYGGGWEGSVGKHTKVNDSGAEVAAGISDPYTKDIYGETHVVIGDVGDDKTFLNGKPAIMRNAYGGGEGGSVWGTTNLTLNNGMIGYRYKNTGTDQYVEELDDQGTGDIEMAGNVFGGGYVVNSYVDNANVSMYGGTVRGSLYGGGEVGPIGRGTVRYKSTYSTGKLSGDAGQSARIFKAGKTNVKMYNGHVLRNVFGGGRGKDNWGGDGTAFMSDEAKAASDLQCKGYVFGQTEVDIYGGEVGTEAGMALNYGNVFGGGDEGYVYSAYEDAAGNLYVGKKEGVRYDGEDYSEGRYYRHNGSAFVNESGTALGEDDKKYLTEDCKVLVEPWLQVQNSSISYDYDGDGTEETYAVGDYIPTAYLNILEAKTGDWEGWENVDVGTATDERGIVIHNAVFAGGNITSGGSTVSANETTVFGNVSASIHDVYNRDFITIGTGHTGGLYGDGSLTFVDGYRELNITNYGTDYYHLATKLPKNDYDLLPSREQAYYEVKYKCVANQGCTDQEGTVYKKEAVLPKDELLALFTYDDGTSVQNNASGALIKKGSTETGTAILTGTIGNLEPNPDIWQENGVVSTYAGRIMNTIQRADFCGVFGSRMVMKGARDRVPEKEDSKLYTINRVREVSLNKMESENASDKAIYDSGDNAGQYINPDAAMHGNYFGIYSNVNFFGSLTSDVDFHKTTRTTNATDAEARGLAVNGKTFAQWKADNIKNKSRNNGNCYNQLALASGVYLELTTEKSTGTTVDKKDWGLITGVVELDLINVSTGVGGGYVYAKNQHGQRKTGHSNTPLTALNATAVSKDNWDYETDDAKREEWETSGNFIHSSQTIIDDCYNESARYKSTDGVPAHYWFISGSVYVYDQYITAHTGAPNAYSETVEIPITIYAASNGKMTLMDVQPNLYAYYSSYTNADTNTPLTGDNKVVVNNVEYHLNDPISYWDWCKLPAPERKLFVEDTYVVRESCRIGAKDYPAGKVLLPSDYETLSSNTKVQKLVQDENGDYVVVTDEDGEPIELLFTEVFRSSNNMSHDTGYMLTYNVTNPAIWEPWYTELTGTSSTNKITTAAYDKLAKASTRDEAGNITTKGQDAYYDGPTYTPKSSGLYGQRAYEDGDLIPEDVYNDYKKLATDYSEYIPTTGQATFVPAHVVTKEYYDSGTSVHYYPGAPVNAEISDYTAPAYICTSTIQLSATEYIYVNDLLTEDEIDDLKTAYPTLAEDIEDLVVPAYYCTSAGLYGGDYYESGKNYRGLAVWSSMSEAERNNFTFNYDALDLLIDPTYGKTDGIREKEGHKYQYDGEDSDGNFFTTMAQAEGNKAGYSLSKPIDYTATYQGASDDVDYDGGKAMTYTDSSTPAVTKYVKVGAELDRTEYEALPNEQRHYAPVTVTVGNVPAENYTVYVVHEGFVHVETPYAVGATLSYEEYTALASEEKTNITTLTFSKDELKHTTTGEGESATTTYETTTFYYCREGYQVNEKGMGQSVTSVKGEGSGTTYTSSTEGGVPKGAIIAESDYSKLVNKQQNFTIHGKSPMETSTLYVSRNSDINDLSTEKIITVIYKYDYEETDVSGLHVTPVSERHIVNIHITFESGVPIIDDIRAPGIVLPGTSITMRVPNVTPGAYEITGGGWEIFEKDSYAENHTNGVPYKPSVDSLYWYQDGFLLAYYAKTYLGRTYSNAVPISVANYHDLKSVMDDKSKHLHVDYDRTRLKRDSKIYINDYTASSENGLDLFKKFYDLSLLTTDNVNTDAYGFITTTKDTDKDSPLKGHHILNQVNGPTAGKNLEFFLRTDIAHEDDWTPIGTDVVCFKGTLHGDGHTISGLDHSLFGNLCGNVYNLGVTGSFNTAGVADLDTETGVTEKGYVESCWVKTTAETPLSETESEKPNAVFGKPTDDKGYQVVNSYFWNGNKNLYNYNNIEGDNPTVDDDTETITSGGDRGKAHAMPAKAFYDGTVAYDLNSFYLNKRYYDKEVPSDRSYKYKNIKADGTVEEEPVTAYYPAVGSENAKYSDAGYVEERFADGDFRYAAGEIPGSEDDRHWEETTVDSETGVTTKTDHWSPIWPDDYLFFGQKLTYGHVDGQTHEDKPSAVRRTGGRIDRTESGNRVYRAPAYFRSKDMDVAHFNAYAVFAQTKKDDPATIAYKDMTAIDFTGHNDKTWAKGSVSDGFPAGKPAFYPPLLDDDGITGFLNIDLTRNLLAYTAEPDAGTAAGITATTIQTKLPDPAYSETDDKYRTVAAYQDDGSVLGHRVEQTGDDSYTAQTDHLLIDRNDFNAPIPYTFASGKRMWYQRRPDTYVDLTKGWEGVSLPFTAELVTTDEKGEITHFYSGSDNSDNNTKLGHEYWLRRFTSGGTEKTVDDKKVFEANLTYPESALGDAKKTRSNTFLWDYYYNATPDGHKHKDKNKDTYQRYYESARDYDAYPLLAKATPYLIGFPGATYYEFDLSGKFQPTTTDEPNPQKLGKQVITFASNAGATIAVSDDELAAGKVTADGYIYWPTYLTQTFPAGTTGTYTLAADGGSYDLIPATGDAVTAEPFRPYFTKVSGGAPAPRIVFSRTTGNPGGDPKDEEDVRLFGYLDIRGNDGHIIVTSHLTGDTTVRIVDAAGALINSFDLQPDQTVTTRVAPGVYLVNRKKIAVR